MQSFHMSLANNNISILNTSLSQSENNMLKRLNYKTISVPAIAGRRKRQTDDSPQQSSDPSFLTSLGLKPKEEGHKKDGLSSRMADRWTVEMRG